MDTTSENDIVTDESTNQLQKFEYTCVAIIGMGGRTTRILNEYAQQGWELVEVTWIWHYFKRPLK